MGMIQNNLRELKKKISNFLFYKPTILIIGDVSFNNKVQSLFDFTGANILHETSLCHPSIVSKNSITAIFVSQFFLDSKEIKQLINSILKESKDTISLFSNYKLIPITKELIRNYPSINWSNITLDIFREDKRNLPFIESEIKNSINQYWKTVKSCQLEGVQMKKLNSLFEGNNCLSDIDVKITNNSLFLSGTALTIEAKEKLVIDLQTSFPQYEIHSQDLKILQTDQLNEEHNLFLIQEELMRTGVDTNNLDIELIKDKLVITTKKELCPSHLEAVKKIIGISQIYLLEQLELNQNKGEVI